eukprot:gene6480-biopygen5903
MAVPPVAAGTCIPMTGLRYWASFLGLYATYKVCNLRRCYCDLDTSRGQRWLSARISCPSPPPAPGTFGARPPPPGPTTQRIPRRTLHKRGWQPADGVGRTPMIHEPLCCTQRRTALGGGRPSARCSRLDPRWAVCGGGGGGACGLCCGLCCVGRCSWELRAAGPADIPEERDALVGALSEHIEVRLGAKVPAPAVGVRRAVQHQMLRVLHRVLALGALRRFSDTDAMQRLREDRTFPTAKLRDDPLRAAVDKAFARRPAARRCSSPHVIFGDALQCSLTHECPEN